MILRDVRRSPLFAAYRAAGFPLIPLVPGTKCPAAKDWTQKAFDDEAFAGRSLGVRAGERVRTTRGEGNLLIVDFDAPNVEQLRRLCRAIPLDRTTCVRTGGNHRGYHLYYLTDFEIRKHSMLVFEDANIDLLGRGSFAVLPPSEVEEPYRYRVGLSEITSISEERYARLLHVLAQWKAVASQLKAFAKGAISTDSVTQALLGTAFTPDMRAYADGRMQAALASAGRPQPA